MCGIAGYWDLDSIGDKSELAVRAMARGIRHRGPDGEGFWLDSTQGLALGHRRLSIVDLTETGRQPMASADGRYAITFNGEIYNHRELRAELGVAIAWRGTSDTEVLLNGIAEWGLEGCLAKCHGMFAFALWDSKEERLSLVRDRIGEKPLYYAAGDSLLLFGSELKALRAHPRWKGEIDPVAVEFLIRMSYIPAPYSIFANVRKLEAGAILHVTGGPRFRYAGCTYWSLPVASAHPEKTMTCATDELQDLLKVAVARQLEADVAVGAFLSGGKDSSLICAVAQSVSARPIKTFTASFEDKQFDESEYARGVAEYLGTEHHELRIVANDALDIVADMPQIFDEPFADSSQLPTFLLSRKMREHVTVALSGDGGDELFDGYPRYRIADSLFRVQRAFPRVLRRTATRIASGFSPGTLTKIFAHSRLPLPAHVRENEPGDKVQKLFAVLAQDSHASLYHELQRAWKVSPLLNKEFGKQVQHFFEERWSGLDSYSRMAGQDLLTYLPDDILVKVDRASMAVSLETRVPMLDHAVVEFAQNLPTSLKVNRTGQKLIVSELLNRYVPAVLFDRPKKGFSVPLGDWLRGPLKDWASDLLSERSVRACGLFDVAVVNQYWREHLSGARNWQYALWNLLMFLAWHRRWNADS